MKVYCKYLLIIQFKIFSAACHFSSTVMSPYKFSIGDTTGDEFQPYETGGIAIEVKVPFKVNFVSITRTRKFSF